MIKERVKATNIQRYGVEFLVHNELIYKKMLSASHRIKCHISGLEYQGTYELHFIEWCIENNISITKCKTFAYKMNNKHIYYPDFYYEPMKLVIEVKSTYTYNYHLEKNLAKQKAVLDAGYNFIFIIDKNYSELYNLISVG